MTDAQSRDGRWPRYTPRFWMMVGVICMQHLALTAHAWLPMTPRQSAWAFLGLTGAVIAAIGAVAVERGRSPLWGVLGVLGCIGATAVVLLGVARGVDGSERNDKLNGPRDRGTLLCPLGV